MRPGTITPEPAVDVLAGIEVTVVTELIELTVAGYRWRAGKIFRRLRCTEVSTKGVYRAKKRARESSQAIDFKKLRR